MKEVTAKVPDNNGRKTPSTQLPAKESQAMLEKILEKLEKIEQTVSRLDSVAGQAPEALTFATNFVDEAAARVQENGQNLEERIALNLQLLDRLTQPAMVKKLNAALEALEQSEDMISLAVDQLDALMLTLQNHGLDPKVMSEDGLKFLSAIISAHHKAMHDPPQKVGLFGMLSTLSDPDFQKFLGFITALGKNFGKTL